MGVALKDTQAGLQVSALSNISVPSEGTFGEAHTNSWPVMQSLHVLSSDNLP